MRASGRPHARETFAVRLIFRILLGVSRAATVRHRHPEALLGLWRGGEGLEAIAAEFGMEPVRVEKILQAYDAGRDAA